MTAIDRLFIFTAITSNKLIVHVNLQTKVYLSVYFFVSLTGNFKTIIIYLNFLNISGV